jgi:hypothetical protein
MYSMDLSKTLTEAIEGFQKYYSDKFFFYSLLPAYKNGVWTTEIALSYTLQEKQSHSNT